MVGTDTSDGRHYVENAAGAENPAAAGVACAANDLEGTSSFTASTRPVSDCSELWAASDPATPTSEINAAESHFKHALDSRRHGLNRN